MSEGVWTIFPGNELWRVGHTTPTGTVFYEVEGGEIDVAADRLAERLNSLGYDGEGALLGLPSSLCLAVTLSPEDSAALHDRRSLAYALEQQLPLAAEEIACAAILDPSNALAVAVPQMQTSHWVAALESRGIVVQSISPKAILALQTLEKSSHPDPCLILWRQGERFESFWMQAGKPQSWQLLPAEAGTLHRQLSMLALDRKTPLHVVACNISDADQATIAAHQDVELTVGPSEEVEAAAASAASQILDGSQEPWLELRGGALAAADPLRPIRPMLRFASIAGAACLLALAGAMFLRAHHYRREASRSYGQQTDVFHLAMPGQKVPAGILSRLRSEYGKLTVSRGDSAAVPKSGTALEALYHLLVALPEDLRYRLLEIRVEDGRIYLDGETLSHGDADRIAASLRKVGFEVEPPRSQQMADRGVSLKIAATAAAREPTTASRKQQPGESRL